MGLASIASINGFVFRQGKLGFPYRGVRFSAWVRHVHTGMRSRARRSLLYVPGSSERMLGKVRLVA